MKKKLVQSTWILSMFCKLSNSYQPITLGMISLFLSVSVFATKPEMPHEEGLYVFRVEQFTPSDPGDLGDDILIGIDSDGDQIRDDVELLIKKMYPLDEHKWIRNSLYNLAVFYRVMMKDSKAGYEYNQALRDSYITNFYVTLKCLEYDFRPKQLEMLRIEIKSSMLNTLDRINRFFENKNFVDGLHNEAAFTVNYYKQKGRVGTVKEGSTTKQVILDEKFCRGPEERNAFH